MKEEMEGKSFCMDEAGSSNSVVNEHGKISQRDHFRGFTKEQRLKIYQENNQIIQKRRYEMRSCFVTAEVV